VREALRAGVRIVCSTDAHSVRGLGNMELAVHTARRGWATAADVVNTWPLRSILDRRRPRDR
jgi:DNA polymerase (family 10)